MATITGSNASDTLSGTGGNDRMFGFNAAKTGATIGRIDVETVATGLPGAVSAGAAPGREGLFVIQKDSGTIWLLDPETGQRAAFLSIPTEEFGKANEEGLLGLAFHPDYAENGRFFVHLVNASGDVEVREYARSTDPDRADPAPVQTILTVPHPTFSNHNGGALAFSPRDGSLYIALGDGGGGGDPGGNGQNTDTLLGSILRLDVDGDDFPGAARNYAIPDDNPFVGIDGSDEIWAYGLRNPWRISFDTNGDLYIADVGQGAREEVNVQRFNSRGGENYGWNLAEGSLGNPPPGSVLPVFEYDHSQGRSITGGHVYHGPGGLQGAYVLTDFVSGAFWTLKEGAATLRTSQLSDSLSNIASFGLGPDGALYAAGIGGSILRLTPSRFAGDLADILRGRGGNDALFGGAGDDSLFGNRDDDRLRGGYGNDTLAGQQGADRLIGDAGDDSLNGGIGADVLRGGIGDDRLTGGKGRDTFVFGARDEEDRITDFSHRDLIRIADGAERFEDLTITRGDGDTMVRFAGTTILVENAALTADDFVF